MQVGWTASPVLNHKLGIRCASRIQPISQTNSNPFSQQTFSMLPPLIVPKHGNADCNSAIYATTTFGISPGILNEIHSLWKTGTNSLINVTNITSVLTYQSIPPPPPANNSNSMPFALDSSPQTSLVLGLVSVYWLLDRDTSRITAAVEEILNLIEQTTKKDGLFTEYKYINYATTSWQKPIRGYGTNSVRPLKRVSRKYDPHGVFQSQVPGGFKLSD